MSDKYAMLRHFLAALAYRTQKALRDAPPGFADFSVGNQARSPNDLVRHMASVLGYARTYFRGGSYWPDPLPTFDDEVRRFHAMLADLAAHLERGDALIDTTPERMLQGPFADAMTHVGQLALLRRIHGSAVPPENFIVADIDPSNLGPEQPLPRAPDKEWRERLE